MGDEFVVVLPPGRSIVPILLPLTGRFTEVPFTLKLGRLDFGDNGWTSRPPSHLPLALAYTASKAIPNSVKSVYQTDGNFLPADVAVMSWNPHEGWADSAGTCQDAHWLPGGIFLCWPQQTKFYWP